MQASEPRTAPVWETPEGVEYKDILYHRADLGPGRVARITINRPEVRNAFRPETVRELIDAFQCARCRPHARGQFGLE